MSENLEGLRESYIPIKITEHKLTSKELITSV